MATANSNEPQPQTQSQPQPDAGGRRYEDVLADAVRVLTEAARLTRPVLERDEEGSGAAGHLVWRETERRERADWAEFVTLALAGAAANIGSVDAALTGRPGSWEADGVRNLLTSTVGEDEEYLFEHRTEPIVIDLYVDELLADWGVWERYDEAGRELDRRHDALGIPTLTGLPGDPGFEEALAQLPPATEEQERQAEAIADLRDRLEEQRQRDWAEYGAALKANVEAAAARRQGLRVPVVVNVDLNTFRDPDDQESDYGLAQRLEVEAIQATPLPGDSRSPLERLLEQQERDHDADGTAGGTNDGQVQP